MRVLNGGFGVQFKEMGGIRELHILAPACEDLRFLCAGDPKIELMQGEKREEGAF